MWKKFFSERNICEGFPSLQRFIVVLEQIVKDSDPELYNHFSTIGLKQFVFTYQWILTLFTYNAPFDAVSVIWSYAFEVGWAGFFRTFLFLIKSNRETLLATDCEKCLELLQMAPAKLVPKNIDDIKNITLSNEHQRMIDDVVYNNIISRNS